MTVLFVDTETTGLDPDRHELWEVAVVTEVGEEHVWQLPADLGRADPEALEISGYLRRRHATTYPPRQFAQEFMALTAGAHLAGIVPSFDEERLRRYLRRHGACPCWHYHLIDVSVLALGAIAARERRPLCVPWESDDLAALLGVEPPSPEERHTALGDAHWARRIYQAIEDL